MPCGITTAIAIQFANLGWSERSGGQRLPYRQTGSLVTERSVGGEQYGRFLIDICEESDDAKRGRNDPSPCGNGKKFKACHGARQ